MNFQSRRCRVIMVWFLITYSGMTIHILIEATYTYRYASLEIILDSSDIHLLFDNFLTRNWKNCFIIVWCCVKYNLNPNSKLNQVLMVVWCCVKHNLNPNSKLNQVLMVHSRPNCSVFDLCDCIINYICTEDNFYCTML